MKKEQEDTTLTYTVGVTQFFDLTEQEFERNYLNFYIPFTELMYVIEQGDEQDGEEQTRLLQTIPTNFDWRAQGAVTPVKNQGTCGACHAFSTVGNIESLYYIKYKQLIPMSEQQLLNCDTYNSGCNGGNMMFAYQYFQQSSGVVPQSSLPYTGITSTCAVANLTPVAKVINSIRYSTKDESYLAGYLYNIGPLAVAINGKLLAKYRGGIIGSKTECDPYALNHAVLLVGYGVSGTQGYWIVKNSWGTNWGEAGYFRIAKGSGTCGINLFVTTAVIG